MNRVGHITVILLLLPVMIPALVVGFVWQQTMDAFYEGRRKAERFDDQLR
jgi:ABC-type sugar transport system permease subunit